MMFRDEFEAEIDHLYQLCAELGRAQPDLAPILGRNADPSVSRLVEGLAFSFGQLRQRLDDDLPEIAHPVLENLCAELLRPLPSRTVMALTPSASKLLSRTTLKAGTAFGTRPIDGVACTFESTTYVDITPWSIAKLEVAGASVRIELEAFPGVDLASVLPPRLVLFLAHPVAAALEARDLFVRRTRDVVARTPGSDATVSLGPPRAWRPAREGTDAPIARAFLDLRDYFTFPQGYAYVEVPDLARVRALGDRLAQLELIFELDAPVPRGIVLDRKTVLLHAVPARNVFRVPDLRIPLRGDRQRCDVRPAVPGAQVYAVRDVALVNQGLQKLRVEPWARFFGLRSGENTEVRYEVRRVPSVIGNAVDVSLSFSGGPPSFRREEQVAAEVSLLATHGERAASLGLGEVNVRTSASPSLVTFENVTPVTRTAAPPLDGDYLWQVYRLFKTTMASLTDDLGEVLALANLAARERWPGAKAGAKSFAPLLRVVRTRDRSTVRDELHAGALVTLVIDAGRFDGPGDIHLFGELVSALLATTLHPRHWLELTITDAAGAKLAIYPRAGGTRLGL